MPVPGPESVTSVPAAALSQPSCDAELAVFFREHHQELRRYLRVSGCRADDCEDLVQDAFLIVRKRWQTITYFDNRKAYLYKVAIRLWHKHSRSSRREHPDDPQQRAQTIADPRDPYADIELADTLIDWFSRLPPRRRAVAALRLIVGLSELETAEALGISTGTVKSELCKARKTLKEFHDRDTIATGDRRRAEAEHDDDR